VRPERRCGRSGGAAGAAVRPERRSGGAADTL
jgi:hypothetical protein